jgi:hypothetical protein
MQEQAVAEGFITDARRRRSVEDHARVLDTTADPGLSATVILRFCFDPTRVPAPAAATTAAAGPPTSFTVPADTLVANATADETSVVFATELALEVFPELDALALFQDGATGDVSVLLAPLPGVERLTAGRWLVFAAEGDPHGTRHVVRITEVDRTAEVTRVLWDPRRPLPAAFAAVGDGDTPRTVVYANVVPAHHGLPLDELGEDDSDLLLGRWRSLLAFPANGGAGLEVPVPLAPISVQIMGYPFPGDVPRVGTTMLRVAVDGETWTRVDDLSAWGPDDRVFAVRSADDGGVVLRFGDDVNGTALPARTVQMSLAMRVGLGAAANVGPGQLTSLVQLGPVASDDDAWLQAITDLSARDAVLRTVLTVANPTDAVEGRDPEDIDALRYRAPLNVLDGQSAVTPSDCERLLEELPEVSAARAEVLGSGVRPLVRVTVLLRDDASLGDPERLRRFADARRVLEDARLLGCDVETVPPQWVPLDLDALVDADPHVSAPALRDSVVEAVAGTGGMLDPDEIGLGGDVRLSILYQTILAVPGVTGTVVRQFRRYEPGAVDCLADGLIPIAPGEVAVLRVPGGGAIDGLFTVTVRGGLQ